LRNSIWVGAGWRGGVRVGAVRVTVGARVGRTGRGVVSVGVAVACRRTVGEAEGNRVVGARVIVEDGVEILVGVSLGALVGGADAISVVVARVGEIGVGVETSVGSAHDASANKMIRLMRCAQNRKVNI